MATIQKELSKPTRRSARAQDDPRGPKWGRLVAEGRQARGAADAGRWRIGHLASLVAKQYGSRSLQQFADDIGETYSTVRRYRWVYKAYDPSVRFRFQQLSFSHFQVVAGLPDRVKWLEPLLDELTDSIEAVRGRLRKVKGVRVGRYNGNGNGHRARARAR